MTAHSAAEAAVGMSSSFLNQVFPLLGFDHEEAAVGVRARGDHAIEVRAILQLMTRGHVVAVTKDDA